MGTCSNIVLILQPILSKRLTKRSIEWRIRNLPYPINTYSVTPSDPNSGADRYNLVVRTTNKKFYKIIPVLELQRCETLPDPELISVQHQHNTLIITVSPCPPDAVSARPFKSTNLFFFLFGSSIRSLQSWWKWSARCC